MKKNEMKEGNPVAGAKSPAAGKRSVERATAPVTGADVESDTEQETQSRESEAALDKALTRLPPG